MDHTTPPLADGQRHLDDSGRGVPAMKEHAEGGITFQILHSGYIDRFLPLLLSLFSVSCSVVLSLYSTGMLYQPRALTLFQGGRLPRGALE